MAQQRRSQAQAMIAPRLKASPWIVLLVLTLGFFMILLDTTIVNIAIPDLEKGLSATFDQVLWTLNAYILVYAVLLITAGRLGDIFGPKRLFLAGLVIFTLSSAACGLAQSPTELIAFRVVQGLGGAILTPQTLSVITTIFPPERRGTCGSHWANSWRLSRHDRELAGHLLHQRAHRRDRRHSGHPADAGNQVGLAPHARSARSASGIGRLVSRRVRADRGATVQLGTNHGPWVVFRWPHAMGRHQHLHPACVFGRGPDRLRILGDECRGADTSDLAVS
jgi:hypothetical protein